MGAPGRRPEVGHQPDDQLLGGLRVRGEALLGELELAPLGQHDLGRDLGAANLGSVDDRVVRVERHIQIMQLMIPADGLPIDDAGAPDAGVLESLGQVLMDRFGEVDDAIEVGDAFAGQAAEEIEFDVRPAVLERFAGAFDEVSQSNKTLVLSRATSRSTIALSRMGERAFRAPEPDI